MSELQAAEEITNNAIVQNSLNPEITGEVRTRDVDGRWLPGHAPNPGGRPKCALISEKLREILRSEDASGETGADKLGKKLVGLTEEKDGYLRLAAIKEITDRVEGKAVQTSNVRGLFVMMPPTAVMAEAFDCPEPAEPDI